MNKNQNFHFLLLKYILNLWIISSFRTSRPTPSRIAFSEEPVDNHSTGIPPFDKRVPLRGLNSDHSLNMPPSGHRFKGSKSAKVPYVTEPEEVVSSCHIPPSQVTATSQDENTDGLVNTNGASQTHAKRPNMAKSRPQSRARPKSASRPKSRAASRAGSRAGSRMGSRISMYGWAGRFYEFILYVNTVETKIVCQLNMYKYCPVHV